MRKTLKKFVSLLMALTILLSLAVPTALAAEQIKVPVSITLPDDVSAVAGVEIRFNHSDGLEYVKWEFSSTLKSAGYADNELNREDGESWLVGAYTATNKYAPDSNGKMDLGYLVFEGVEEGQSITIEEAMFVIVIDKETLDSRTVAEDITINLGSGSGSEGGSSSGVIIDGSNADANVNTLGGGNTSTSKPFPFVDVKTSDWFYDEVKGAYNNGLINGKTATEYRPNDTLTVAEAIKLAAALHQLDNAGKVTLQNGSPNWYSSYVKYAVDNGIIEAKYSSYSLAQMNAPIKRNEFVHIFHGAMDNYDAINTISAIPDVNNGSAYNGDIYEFYRAGILTGSAVNGVSGYFKPNDNIKRSEVAAILVRMYDTGARVEFSL